MAAAVGAWAWTAPPARLPRRMASREPLRMTMMSAAAIDRVGSLRGEVEEAITATLDRCITTTDLGVGKKRQGKVRDTYDAGDVMVIVTTDRQSAFDRILAAVPFKGQVLNQTSAWWMKHTSHIVQNALLSTPDSNIAVMRKCSVLPVEVVVRGYMTGSTSTSLWTHYSRGERNYCGNAFPDGLRKNDRLPENVITPTTKSEDHDMPISPQEILSGGLLTAGQWATVSAAALELFRFGQEEAAKRGLILVDTKYEFGLSPTGEVLLIDEIHTPDSSRYWLASTYEERHAAGKEPENIDKEFLRLWFKDNCDPYNDKVLPEAPRELVTELSRRYVQLYEMITGESFVLPDLALDPGTRMKAAIKGAGLA